MTTRTEREESPPGEVTALLARISAGDSSAMDRLYPIVYQELRRRAHRQLNVHRPGDTLGTTALVHEAYLKLGGGKAGSFHDRGHFLAVASRAMRQIVIDEARQKLAAKRGGGIAPVALATGDGASPPDESADGRATRLLALDDALEQLSRLDERLAHTVELRFFGDLSVEETAVALGVSPRTVKRDWQKARAILHAALDDTVSEDPMAPAAD